MPFSSVPLPKEEELPSSIRATLTQIPALNVFLMLANVPVSFHPYLQLVKSIYNEGKFNPKLRQIAILRQAHMLHSQYEWHQQVFLSKANGVKDSEIEIISSETPVTSLGEEGNFICRVSDELTLKAQLSDATFQELYKRYSIELGTELILAISYANMLGRFINGTRVQIEKTNPLESYSSPMGKSD
jgi:alkylhydroperoxidase family enzyme